MKFVEINLI